MVSHRRMSDQASVVELLGREVHNRFIHAILDRQLTSDLIAKLAD